MSWYVLQCRKSREQEILSSLKKNLSNMAMDEVFTFGCQRLWHLEGEWKITEKSMFPGYLFIESKYPQILSKELYQYRPIVKILEEPGYLISVYEEEEVYLKHLCGPEHFLALSYGYKDHDKGESYITEGPLLGQEKWIKKYDWHRRYAQLEVSVAGKNVNVWAGLDFYGRNGHVVCDTG